MVERLTFQRMRQHADESSDDFLSCLTNQVNSCKFKECDKRIIKQIAYDTKHADIQKILLVQDETYILAKAIEACHVYDASEGHQKAFQQIQGGEVAVSIVQKGGTSPAQCYNCGESRHRSSQGCPAGTAEQWVFGQKQKPALANHHLVKAPDLATDLNLVIAPAIEGDTEIGDKTALAW